MYNPSITSLYKLEKYCYSNNWKGWDPFDFNNSKLSKFFPFTYPKINWIATNILKFSPINIRYEIGMKKTINQKSMGLFLSSYAKINGLEKKNLLKNIDSLKKSKICIDWLNQNRLEESGMWGTNFNFTVKNRFAKQNEISVVSSCYICNGLLQYCEISDNREFIINVRRVVQYLKKWLYSEDPFPHFKYMSREDNIIINSNFVVVSLLSRLFKLTRDDSIYQLAIKIIDNFLRYQTKDGYWPYSVRNDPKNTQIDFHQGFILDGIYDFIKLTQSHDDKYLDALYKGVIFYKKQFDEQGRCYWRYPKKWPIDIHNQAQGIITFSKLDEFIPGSLYLAEKVATWTIENMQDDMGYFYYQKWPLFTNKIPYMRWSQAWMMLGLSELITSKKR